MKEIYVVVETEHGNVFVTAFQHESDAEQYGIQNCTGDWDIYTCTVNRRLFYEN